MIEATQKQHLKHDAMNDVLADLAATNLVSEDDLAGAFEGNPGSGSTTDEEEIKMYESDWELETLEIHPDFQADAEF